MVTFYMGKDAKVYYGVDDAELAAMTELAKVRDVELTLDAGEADVTTRDGGGWKATAPTLRECSAEFEMLWNPGDAGFEAIRDAYLGGTTLEVALLDQGKSVTGAQGPKGNFSVTSFSRGEGLEDHLTAKVTVKLAAFDEWVEVNP